MDKIISEYLPKLTFEKDGNFFKDVAHKLTGETINDEKKAKLIVRENISDGLVKASNDNIAGLKKQVEDEKNGKGLRTDNIRAYLFNANIYNIKMAEKYLFDKKIDFAKPRKIGNNILIPIDNIKKNDKLILKKIDDNISVIQII